MMPCHACVSRFRPAAALFRDASRRETAALTRYHSPGDAQWRKGRGYIQRSRGFYGSI